MQRVVAALCLALLILIAGCKQQGRKEVPTVDVKGTVTLDNNPMPEGEVTFSIPGEPVNTIPIKNGSFAGKANIGKNRVEFAVYRAGPPLSTDPEKKPTKQNILPPKFSFKSDLTADVAAGGANDFKFAVTSQ